MDASLNLLLTVCCIIFAQLNMASRWRAEISSVFSLSNYTKQILSGMLGESRAQTEKK
jgi:hypothetical protein